MKPNILVFSSREICYLSGNFFAHELADAFEQLGCDVTLCEFTKEDDLDKKLMPFLDNEYQAILDFNSLIPQMVLDDDTPYLDHLHGPFFDYVLDHPLFHYNVLSSKTKNLNAFVLDEAQRAYVDKYYPSVKQVYALPLGATKALYDGEKNEEVRVFLPGTYDSPDDVYAIIQASPEPLHEIMTTLVDMRLADPLTPMEEHFRAIVQERELPVTDAQFALYMNAMYAVDAYVRDYFRKKALDELLDADLPVTVMGAGWNHYSHKKEHNLKRAKEVPFALSFERIAKEHILLDVSPIFSRGMHDRVPAGMANHAAVLTDQNPYLQKHLKEGEEIACFSLTKEGDLVEKAGKLLEDRSLREQIQESAYEKFCGELTWECRAREILSLVR